VISCEDFIAELGDYLEGDVARLVRAQLENHLAHCAQCRVVYDSARKTVKIITESDSFDLADDAVQDAARKIMTRIRAHPSREL
jgi:predicted anti-sigma-YlaC factor YlaD